jgi:hypothetical protein
MSLMARLTGDLSESGSFWLVTSKTIPPCDIDPIQCGAYRRVRRIGQQGVPLLIGERGSLHRLKTND